MSTADASSSGSAGGWRTAWQTLADDWTVSEGPAWLHVGKTLCAALLTLWLAMRLELEQPRTAMLTVFIVMQPQSGAVLAKSFYRIGGTVIGCIVTVILVGLFPQEHILFLAAMSCWLAFCTAGATRNRNFRSYGFVLAGYTAALIGIPTMDNANAIFDSAVTRLTEVSLGILVSTVVSAVIFPQHVANKIPRVVRGRFVAFVDFIAGSLSGRIDRAGIEASNLRFVSDVIGLEAARSMGVFETPEVRLRSSRLSQLNHDFMAVSTRLHALHQTLNRLRVKTGAGERLQAQSVLAAFEPYLREIAPRLSPSDAPVLQASDAYGAAQRLSDYRLELPARIARTRAELDQTLSGQPCAQPIRHAALLDFDTSAELFYRFIDELHTYTRTYASLSKVQTEHEPSGHSYVPKTGVVASVVSGLRAVLALGVMCFFWYATAWPAGALATIFAGVGCAIAATAPNPFRTSYQLAIGAVLALPAGAVVNFLLAPQVAGYPLLACILAPFLIIALYASTRPGIGGIGIGFLLFFGFGAVPDNPIHYDPVNYFNSLLGILAGTTASAVAFGVVLPPTSGWWLKRIVHDLRQLVVKACVGQRDRIGRSFESASRDLMYQAGALIEDKPDAQSIALSWMFVTLEIGHAMIELRTETAALEDSAEFARDRRWSRPLHAARDELVALFERPSIALRRRALAAIKLAIDHVQLRAGSTELAPLANDANAGQTTGHRHDAGDAGNRSGASDKSKDIDSTTGPTRIEPGFGAAAPALPLAQRQRLLRMVSYLHFMRTALLDPMTPLPGGSDFREFPSGEADAA